MRHMPEPLSPIARKVVEAAGGRGSRRGATAAFGFELAGRYGRHRDSIAAGGLAFFTALALAPAALAIGSLAGLVISPQRLRDAMASFIDAVPAAASLQPFVDELANFAERTSAVGFTVTGVVSLVIALFAASRAVVAGRQILDVSFNRGHLVRGLMTRVVATVVTLLLLLGGLVAIIVITVIPAVLGALSIDGWFVNALRGPLAPVVAAAIGYVVVRSIYTLGPQRPTRIGWWSPGAAFAVAWLVGVGIGLDIYITRSASWGVTVAVLGSAAVLLLWLYLCAVGLVIGAEIEGLRLERESGAGAAGSEPLIEGGRASEVPGQGG